MGKGPPGLSDELTLTEIDPSDAKNTSVLRVNLGKVGIEIALEADAPKTLEIKKLDRAALLSDEVRVYRPILPTAARPDDPTQASLAKFAETLIVGTSAPALSHIPAAYTYLGQFIAHDISQTRLTDLGETLALLPGALRFDSLFGRSGTATGGSGNSSFADPFGDHALGLTTAPPGRNPTPADLPREAGGRPRIPDPRNDSNLNLAQLHVLFVRFARAAQDVLAHLETDAQIFAIRRHLQAMVWGDYIKRLVPDPVINDILANGRRLVATPSLGGLMAFHVPPEFAWGAFQVPHAMIREKYQPWGLGADEVSNPPGNVTLATLLRQTFGGRGLVDGRLTDEWRISWDTMLGRPNAPPATPSARVSTTLRPDVFLLPGRLFSVKEGEQPAASMNLALRTMEIARALMVPSGQELAAFARTAGADVTVLTPEDLAGGLSSTAAALFKRRGRNRVSLAERTPLWLYCLRECELAGGGSLGPLGGRIVAETLHAAIEASETDFFDSVTGWDAGFGERLPSRQPGKFDLYDLRALADSQ